MSYKVLFLDKTHDILKEKLRAKNIDCVDYSGNIDDYYRNISDFDGIIVRSSVISKDMLIPADKLRFIGRLGSGMDNIDVEFAERKEIQCFNSAEGSRDAVGEHSIGLLMALFHNIAKSDMEVRKGIWNREANRGLEIKNKTIGIIGYGNMGSAFAQRLSGFGTKVIAYDKYKKNYSDEYVREVSIEVLFSEADVCSMHVPLTEETSYMVDSEFIESFKKEIYLINTSRGKVVKTNDLVKALKTGKVLGAALDVIEYEDTQFEALKSNSLPEAFTYLKQASNVVLTPHIAGYTLEAKEKLAIVLAEKAIKVIENL